MAQTKRKTKHRGNAAGAITNRGRTGRPPSAEEKKAQAKARAKEARLTRKPTWKMMWQRAAFTSVVIFALLLFTTRAKGIITALALAVLAFVVYVPAGYYLETYLWRRRMAKLGRPAE